MLGYGVAPLENISQTVTPKDLESLVMDGKYYQISDALEYFCSSTPSMEVHNIGNCVSVWLELLSVVFESPKSESFTRILLESFKFT